MTRDTSPKSPGSTEPTQNANRPETADVDWSALALALALCDPPATPPAGLRERLLASAELPERRFAPFLDRLAAMIDLGIERTQELLQSLADPSNWTAPLGPGIGLIHVQGGASVATADVGFVRVDPGSRFPLHHHGGDERVLVLQGLLKEDGSGALAAPGDEVYRGPDTSHSVTSAGELPLIYAVVAYDIDVPGLELPHAD